VESNEKRRRFEALMMGHLDAAYNLARWLTGNREDAQDAVQEAYLRAYRYFGGFDAALGRPWLLAIVRNACFSLIEQRRIAGGHEAFDEGLHGGGALASAELERAMPGPEQAAVARSENARLERAIAALPPEFREVLVLRELEGLSYKDIAHVADIPMGTVMSRLSRARQMLSSALAPNLRKVKSA